MRSIDDFLDTPIYIFDFESQFSDLMDFIEFSENNLEWQRRSHIQSLDRQAKLKNYDSDEYFAELQGIEYRFEINLPRKIRYSAIVAFATTIEWIAAFIRSHKTWELSEKENGINESIHIIKELMCKASEKEIMCVNNNIEALSDIIKIRNCIAHSGGVIDGYKFEGEIQEITNNMKGFSITNEHFVGNSIDISKGAIDLILNETQSWIIKFIKECRLKGVINVPDYPRNSASVQLNFTLQPQ